MVGTNNICTLKEILYKNIFYCKHKGINVIFIAIKYGILNKAIVFNMKYNVFNQKWIKVFPFRAAPLKVDFRLYLTVSNPLL